MPHVSNSGLCAVVYKQPKPKRREVRWPATVLARPWRTAPHLTHTATPRHSWLVREAKRLREENCDLREHNAYLQEDNTRLVPAERTAAHDIDAPGSSHT